MAWHGRGLGLGLCLLAAATATGCGDDSGSAPPVAGSGTARDAGPTLLPDLDAGPLPPLPVFRDAALPNAEGDPPSELADERCAVDTNKLYALASMQGFTAPAALAVNLFEDNFGVGFVDEGTCLDGAFVAELEGPSGSPEPDVSQAFDECSSIESLAIGNNSVDWLLAVVDNREQGHDVWVQAYRPGAPPLDAHRITDSPVGKGQVGVVGLLPDDAMVAWIETDSVSRATALKVRPLDAEGMPTGDEVTLEQDDGAGGNVFYSEPSLSMIGDEYVALGVVRTTPDESIAELYILGYDGTPVRDPMILTRDSYLGSSIDLGADELGGGVVYGIAAGSDARQLWFQQLGPDGRAADQTVGIEVVGSATPKRIVTSPDKAVDFSVAKLGNGYAVVYRAIEGGIRMAGDERIMVKFVDSEGGVRGPASALALAEPVGGKTAIEFAYDGRVVIAWNDLDELGNRTLTVVRLPCVGGSGPG